MVNPGSRALTGEGKDQLLTGSTPSSPDIAKHYGEALFPGDVAYVWHASLRSADFAQSLIASGFELRAQIIWAKDQLQISRGHYHWQHEPCWFAARKGATAHWQKGRSEANHAVAISRAEGRIRG